MFERTLTNVINYARFTKLLRKHTFTINKQEMRFFSEVSGIKKSLIFSNEKILHAVQMSNVYKDSKTFVDMVTKYDEHKVLENFNKLGESPSIEDIRKFLDENFHEVGYDLVQVEPIDWQEKPPLILSLNDEKLINFACFLNSKWKLLLRKFDRKNMCPECSSTGLFTKNSFIVPGGRFIEYYYWDTFWCIDGLLTCGMIHTARGIIENFLDIVRINGFVPNGSRIYYLNRSQPPLLTQMVDLYYQFTNDKHFLKEALPYLEQEYEYWMHNKSTKVCVNNEKFTLNWYRVISNLPRPESYKEDYKNANESDSQENYFSNIMTAAESGWDFSSRWFQNPLEIQTIQITNIIPVDLNAIMFRNETCLRDFHRILNSPKAKFYELALKKREKAINTILWNKRLRTWGDFNIKTKKLHNNFLYVSDLSPLWSGVKPPVDPCIILERYKSLLFCHVSGVPASNILSHQQWDYPNVWAPYQYWIVEYLRLINREEEALNIAQRFINSVYHGWLKTNYIFEKYDADNLGSYGGGGEYIIQEGFGWTNGVVLKFIEWFGDKIKLVEPKKEKEEKADELLLKEECMADLCHDPIEEQMKINDDHKQN